MMRSLLCMACAVVLFSCGGKKEDATNKNNIDSMNVREVVGVANIEPIDRILSITSEVSGVVQTIKVTINQEVKKGDILYILNNDLEQAQLNQAQSKLATQQSVISRSQTGERYYQSKS
jgi:HlyD family secretion protein